MVNSINSLGNNSQDQELLKRKEDFNKARSVFEKKKPTTTLTTRSQITVTSLSAASSSTNTDSAPTKPEKPPKPSTATTTEEAANKTTIVAQNSSTLSQVFSYYVGYGVFGAKLPDELYIKELARLKEVIQKDPGHFAHVGTHFQDEKELALIAVRGNAKMILYASKRLRQDEEVMFETVKQNGMILAHVGINPNNILITKKIALEAIGQNQEAFLHIGKELQKDPDIIKATFSKTQGYVSWFYNLPFSFTDNKDAMLLAVKENGIVISLGTNGLRRETELLLEAIQQGDPDFIKMLPKWDIWGNLDVAAAALKKDGLLLRNAQPFVRKNKKAVLPAVTQNGLALQYADKSLQDDKEIVLAAVKQNGLAIQYASERLRNDPEVKAACKY